MLSSYDEQVFKQATQSLTLFGWSLFEPTKAPPIEYIKKRNSIKNFLVNSEREVPDNEAAWNALLDAYHFTNVDEFDLVLIQGMRDGYFDKDALTKAAVEFDKNVNASKIDDSFRDSWNLFHDSLEDNENQFLDALTSTFQRSLQNISFTNLNGTVKILKSFNRHDLAAKSLANYIENHGSSKKNYDLGNYSFREDITDPDVINALNEKYASFGDERDPAETLLGIAQGWHPDDLTFLANLPVDTFYGVFKAAPAERRRQMINAALQFDRTGGSDESMKTISRRAKEALLRIGGESRINALRVARYGIVVEGATTHASAPSPND